MENKLEQLTQKLYNEGLSKGRSDADALVAEAKAEAKKIVAEAEAQAEKIIKAAKQSAEEIAKNTQTEIALASKQVVSTLKESIADMIVAKSVKGAVSSANLDPAFVKDILIAVAKNWNGNSSEKITLCAMLPSDKKTTLEATFEASAKQIAEQGIEIAFADKVKSGFKIGPKNGGYYISFTDSDFDALLGEFLRPKVAQILYGNK